MRIVDRKTFLALPTGTVFQEYNGENGSYIGQLRILTHVYDQSDDYVELEVTGTDIVKNDGSEQLMYRQLEMDEHGAEYPLQFDGTSRNGCFDADQRYAVWSDKDIRGLIKTLMDALESVANP